MGCNDTSFQCDGSTSTFRVMFKEPVEILPNTNYIACATLKVRRLSVCCCSLSLSLPPPPSLSFSHSLSLCVHVSHTNDAQQDWKMPSELLWFQYIAKVGHYLTHRCVPGCRAQTRTTGAKDYARWPTSLCPAAKWPFSSPTQQATTMALRWRMGKFQKSSSTPRPRSPLTACVHTISMQTNLFQHLMF